jgi:hypothetical protein
LNKNEINVLNLSGVDSNLIVIKDVKVGDFDGKPITIHTLVCGTEEKPKLVYCHGYGGSGAL